MGEEEGMRVGAGAVLEGVWDHPLSSSSVESDISGGSPESDPKSPANRCSQLSTGQSRLTRSAPVPTPRRLPAFRLLGEEGPPGAGAPTPPDTTTLATLLTTWS
jgi:hypothetical protein